MYYECECARSFTFPSTTVSAELSSIDFVPTRSSSIQFSSRSSALTESSTTSLTSTLASLINSSSSIPVTEETVSTPMIAKIIVDEKIDNPANEDYDDYVEDLKRVSEPESSKSSVDDSGKSDGSETTSERRKRSPAINVDEEIWGKLKPGACLKGFYKICNSTDAYSKFVSQFKGCAIGFWSFSIVSMVINCLGCSARIGNLLINYRCVSKQDKSVTQGLILMLISLFALIPGPILYGKIIDSTCIVWTEQCSGLRGNCQLYDQRKFRYYVNLTALALTSVGVFFDFLVWKYGRNLDLYGDREEEAQKKQRTKNWHGNQKN